MVKYEVKCKQVDGEKKYGIIDEQLNEVQPFHFDQIIEKDGAFVLRRDNKPDLVFCDGELLIKEEDQLYNIEVIRSGIYKA
ncbi:MAG: hypothetical protein K2I72_01245, partial [Bacilli bacterium]|nr:hypothetical protein [Bacilli bacterium]